MSTTHPSIVFIDETGITADPNQQQIGIGAFIVHANHLVLNQELRNVFLDAIHHLRAVEERFEFKFTYITKQSQPYYERIIDILQEQSSCWEFKMILEVRDKSPFWEHYLALVSKILQDVPGDNILLADHLNKPKRAHQGLGTLEKAGYTQRAIQIESQGSILLQACDILLGAAAYTQRNGIDTVKQSVALRVEKLLQQKREPV